MNDLSTRCELTVSPNGEIVMPAATQAEVRSWMMKFTNQLLSLLPEQKIDFDVKHTFLNGMYMRELFIPKGSVLVGKVHKLPCMNIVSKGDISILTELGSARITAGHSAMSPPGIQKLGIANDDTVFVNVFRTDETDVNKIEDEIAFSSYEEAGYTLIGERGKS